MAIKASLQADADSKKSLRSLARNALIQTSHSLAPHHYSSSPPQGIEPPT